MFAEEKLETIEQAILDLQSGKRTTSVHYGDISVQYASMSLDELLKLRSQIKAGMNGNEKRPRQAHFQTSKGLA
ncbi:MAG: hypothetical protein IJ730_04170 [Alphaproteobacteria bacterium]|nr:hypothetical protein [Alphaproteobacteria bacterium]